MPKADRWLQEHKEALKLLLRAIETEAVKVGVTGTSERFTRLAAVMPYGTNPETLQRNWNRWSADHHSADGKHIAQVVAAASKLGWLPQPLPPGLAPVTELLLKRNREMAAGRTAQARASFRAFLVDLVSSDSVPAEDALEALPLMVEDLVEVLTHRAQASLRYVDAPRVRQQVLLAIEVIKRAEELADELLSLTVPDMDLNGEVRPEDLPGDEDLQAELEAQLLEAQRQAVNRVLGSNLLAARARKQFKLVR